MSLNSLLINKRFTQISNVKMIILISSCYRDRMDIGIFMLKIRVQTKSLSSFIQYIGKQTQHENNINWSRYAQWALLTAHHWHRNMLFLLSSGKWNWWTDKLPSDSVRSRPCFHFTGNFILIEKSFLGDCVAECIIVWKWENHCSLSLQSTHMHTFTITFSLSIISMDVFSWANFFNSDLEYHYTKRAGYFGWARNSWLMETIDSMPMFCLSQPKWFLFLFPFCFGWKQERDLSVTFYSIMCVCARVNAVSFPTVFMLAFHTSMLGQTIK